MSRHAGFLGSLPKVPQQVAPVTQASVTGSMTASASGRENLPPVGGADEWLVGGGEMGDLLRAKDWSLTPLGSRMTWSPCLRMAASLVVESPTPMVLAWGPDFINIYNDAYRAIAGAKHPAALGMSTKDSWPEIWPIIAPLMARTFERGEACSIEDTKFTINRKGTLEDAYFTVAYSPVRQQGIAGSPDAIVAVLVTLQETTAAHERDRLLRESEERFRILRDRAPFAVCLSKASDGTLVDANANFLELFHGTRTSMLGKAGVDMGITDAESRGQILDELRTHGVVRNVEVTRKTVSGKTLDLLLNVDPVAIGGETFLLSTINDISERKQAERDLQIAHARLSEADRRKSEFLAVLSHELRNPLAPVRNGLALLERAPAGSETFERAKAIVHRQVDYMARLIDDLMDITRISRDKVELQRERLDLNALVARTADDHRSVFDKQRLRLTVALDEAPIWVHGDRTRLAQVIGNLLQNAVKFTPPGGETRVRLRAEGPSAVLDVSDTGRGIAPEVLPRLFEPFSQAEASLDRPVGGLGLGLAIVKGLVELHGGTVSAENATTGTGCTFTVRLPLDESVPVPVPSPNATASTQGHRILLIEDNLDAADTLQELLELEGYTVSVANDGREGVEKAQRELPTVVLCDLGLPGLTGFEVAAALRATPSLRGLYLVALTGYTQPDDIRKVRAAGFDAHVAKPARLETLVALLNRQPARP